MENLEVISHDCVIFVLWGKNDVKLHVTQTLILINETQRDITMEQPINFELSSIKFKLKINLS